MAPFDLTSLMGSPSYALIFLVIGLAFGATLELAGFGDSRKLAAQFYLTDMTVLKVMFTAIVVACVLIFLSTSFGLLDFSRLWVNPTYVWPGIFGGLIMGVGFVIGGYCPGTSLVAAATFKIDGIFFVLGVLSGVAVFGETVGSFQHFFLSSYLGRLTLPDWLGLPVGLVVVFVVLMALLFFWAAERIERIVGSKASWRSLSLWPSSAVGMMSVGALVATAVVVAIHGQPNAEQRWEQKAWAEQPRIDRREVLIHPAEVVALRSDPQLYVNVFDLRSERDYNLFHLSHSRRVTLQDTTGGPLVRELLDASSNVVTFVVSNGERTALAAWKNLRGQGVLNVYVIEGGINRWLRLYPPAPCVARAVARLSTQPERSAFRFNYAVGSMIPSAQPELPPKLTPIPCAVADRQQIPAHWQTYSFTKKVKLQVKKIVKGGCG